MPEFKIGIEISEGLLHGSSSELAKSGATLIINLSASYEIIGRAEYRRTVSMSKSGELLCAYIHVSAGVGESTTDLVFAGHNLILENGKVLSESKLFESEINYADVDFQRIQHERMRSTEFVVQDDMYEFEYFSMKKNRLA